MILCVCLNTALDKTISLDRLNIGQVNRSANVREEPGGKGVNAARTVAALGGDVICTGFTGGLPGQTMERILREEGVPTDFVPMQGNTRTNVVVFEKTGRVTTDINENGPTISSEELKLLKEKIDALLRKRDILVLSGSVPSGIPDTIYADLIRLAASKGALSILDATNNFLKAGLAEKPTVVKPNVFEAEELFGEGKTALDYARKLHERGISLAVVSEGAAGAAFAYEEGSSYIPAFDVVPESSVGAGDAMVGAIAFGLATGMSMQEICVFAQASSAAAVEMPGNGPGKKERIYELYRSYIQK